MDGTVHRFGGIEGFKQLVAVLKSTLDGPGWPVWRLSQMDGQGVVLLSDSSPEGQQLHACRLMGPFWKYCS